MEINSWSWDAQLKKSEGVFYCNDGFHIFGILLTLYDLSLNFKKAFTIVSMHETIVENAGNKCPVIRI